MKFATVFQEALSTSDYPSHWQQAAIQYKLLKKAVKKVAQELDSIGLHPSVLASLIEKSEQGQAGGFEVHYDDLRSFQPKLILTCDASCLGGVPTVKLDDETRRVLEKFAAANPAEVHDGKRNSLASVMSDESAASDNGMHAGTRTIEIPLHSDTDFFQSLKAGLSNLDELQNEQKTVLTHNVEELGLGVGEVAAPFLARSDLALWQEIFGLYLEAGIFFATNEMDHGKRTAVKAQEKLVWFQKEVNRMGSPNKFKNPQSLQLLKGFYEVNAALLRNLQFQEINEQACAKILKKFDKRTHLGVKEQVSHNLVLSQHPFMSADLSKAVCFTMRDQLINTVPLLNEYLCPVCQDIVFKPVRLSCTHVFCVRCLVKLQRDKKNLCPLCRSDVVMRTTVGNLDTALLNFLRLYFPQEVKMKEIEAGREVVREQFGEPLTGRRDEDAEEVRCVVM